MTAPVPAKPSKADRIVEAALRILRDDGDQGLTMRRVARDLGMSLSNVQYYFRDKDTLLVAMVEHYTRACASSFEQQREQLGEMDAEARRRFVLKAGLSHGHRMTEMCALFRQMWAIGSHNDAVSDAVAAYYRAYAVMLADLLLPSEATAAVRRRVVLLVLPYVEGYSVAGSALAETFDEATELLMDLIRAIERDAT